MCRTLACVDCQKEFVSQAQRGPIPKRCEPCRRATNAMQHRIARRRKANAGHDRVCVQCNKQWLARHPKARFCSRNCQYLASGGRVVLKCQQCEKQFTSTQKRKDEGHKFCGKACMWQARQPIARNCVECGKQFRRSVKGPNGKNDKALFCSKPCYFVARNAGRVSWDRSAMAKGSWHRGGRYASAPSVRWALEARTLMRGWLQRGAGLWDALAKTKWCEVCGEMCNHGASRFCSYGCASEWRGDRACGSCGEIAYGLSAYSKARCMKCRSEFKKQANKRAKKKYGRNHRQRARHHGVTYVSVPVADIYERDGYRCQLCGKMCFKVAKYSKSDGRIHRRSPTIDHIVAMACGGNHEPGNLQTACFECNSRKGARSAGQLRMEFA